jgi:hypothetical protein
VVLVRQRNHFRQAFYFYINILTFIKNPTEVFMLFVCTCRVWALGTVQCTIGYNEFDFFLENKEYRPFDGCKI